MSAWVKSKINGEVYSAEASELKGTPEQSACPGCQRPLPSKGEVHKDAEGEITHWTFKCQCGATLIIFND